MSDDEAQALGYAGESGVVIASVEPAGPAASAGLRRGMLIPQVQDRQGTRFVTIHGR